ncbi:MAG: hypothetical protein DI616_15795 [Paracoccus denitrificans]|uniref:Uncharacterized protein n=1 Tax=Paracoccus denitrificans TaxID=266 RepID=A0A533I0F9_PARDE|nr:MAG: hypothetical protein DI616_15795 [Paracoccus denitrificans]
MKTCCDCNIEKPSEAFVPKKSCKDGLEPRCRVCRSIKYNKSTPTQLAKKIRNTQVLNSATRGHEAPTYTVAELEAWLMAQPRFPCLYFEWEASEFKKAKAPSVDRIDNSKGYTFDNMRLMSWEENRAAAAQSKKDCELIVNHRAVNCLNKDGTLHKSYLSLSDALRDFGVNPKQSWGITSVANGVPVPDGKGQLYAPRTYKGYRWEWA